MTLITYFKRKRDAARKRKAFAATDYLSDHLRRDVGLPERKDVFF